MSIPSSDGTITAAYDAATSPHGSVLEVLDVDNGDTPKTHQNTVRWSTQGPPGPQGDPGPQGPPGTLALGATLTQGITYGTSKTVLVSLNVPPFSELSGSYFKFEAFGSTNASPVDGLVFGFGDGGNSPTLSFQTDQNAPSIANWLIEGSVSFASFDNVSPYVFMKLKTCEPSSSFAGNNMFEYFSFRQWANASQTSLVLTSSVGGNGGPIAICLGASIYQVH